MRCAAGSAGLIHGMTSFHLLEKKSFYQDVISMVWGNKDPADMVHFELTMPESFALGKPTLCLLSSTEANEGFI